MKIKISDSKSAQSPFGAVDEFRMLSRTPPQSAQLLRYLASGQFTRVKVRIGRILYKQSDVVTFDIKLGDKRHSWPPGTPSCPAAPELLIRAKELSSNDSQ